MPSRRKSYGVRKTSKSAKRTSTYRARKSYRSRKYTKVSRRRPTWQAGTTVSPYRKFTYNDEDYAFSLTNIAPSVWKLFRGNGCYDPDYDIGGTQPYGFDQLCPAFFQRYNVKGSKITVYPFISANNTVLPARIKMVVVPYFDTTIPYTEYTDIINMPYARSVLLSYYSNDNKTCKISSYVPSTKPLGPNQAKDANASALWNANPTYQWYWFVFCFSGEPVPAGDTITVRYDIKIVYYTYLSQKVELNES